MPMSGTSEAAGSTQGVSNQLASLVPTFNPATDDLTTYKQRWNLFWPLGPETGLQSW